MNAHPRYMRTILATAVGGMLVLQACARMGQGRPRGERSPDSGRRYEGNGLVLEAPGREPVLCLGGVAESYPPQCGTTILVRSWNWDRVEGEEEASGVTWGHYHVVGPYDGTSFTVLEAGPPEPPFYGVRDPIETPCAEPEGGWMGLDPSQRGEGQLQAAKRAAQAEPDFAGMWLDHPSTEPEAEHPRGPVVLNVAFTSDLQRHREELRGLWEGPLCVTLASHTLPELERIQQELTEGAAEELGLIRLDSDIDVVHNRVEIGVVTIDPETRGALSARYGEGTVRVSPALTPVP